MSQGNLVHTLPIHMGVADPVLWGLSDMQLLKVGAGIVVAGCLWRQTALPLGLRTALGVLALGAAVASALVHIQGRSLEEWLLIVGRYWARPRTLVWGPCPPDHPWARAATATRPANRADGGCLIRHLRVTWLEPEEVAA
jgi:hypothetical protein